MATSPNMGFIEPTDHGSTSTWGAALNAALDLIDAHDHTTGKGVKIPSAALNVNSDVAWSSSGSNFAISSLKAIDFAAVSTSAVSGFAGALFVNSADNELYYRTIGGSNVKLTNGASLNVASFVGGIGGDYSAVGALESFDDATKRYLFQSEGSPRSWSGVAHADIDLYEKAVSIVNKITLKSPGSLAASYTLTMPTALPSVTALVKMSTSGQLTVGASTTRQYSCFAFEGEGGASINITATLGAQTTSSIAADLGLPIGATVTAIRMFIKGSTTGVAKITFWSLSSTGTSVSIGTSSNSALAATNQTLTLGSLNTTVALLTSYTVEMTYITGAGIVTLWMAEVDYSL